MSNSIELTTKAGVKIAVNAVTGGGGGGGVTAHSALTGLTTGDDHTQYQRSESVYTTAGSYTVTDESTVVSTGSTVVLPSAQAQAGRTVLVGAGADVTVTCAGTDVFLDGVGSTTFLVRSGNGVGFTSVDAGGTWGWAIVTRQGSTYDLPAWAGQSLAEGKVLRIDGTGAPAWANVAAADVPSLAASKITSGTFDTARLASTGTADATTFLRGDGSWAAPTATVADGAVTTAKIADSAVTSAKIADGTIVDADVSASAAIASTKISGINELPLAANDYWNLAHQHGGNGYTATGTASNALNSNNFGRLVPFHVARQIQVDALVVVCQAANAGASAVVRLGIYNDSSGRPGTVVVDGGTTTLNGTGLKTQTFTAVTLNPGWYWAALLTQSLDTAGTNPTFSHATGHYTLIGVTTIPTSNETSFYGVFAGSGALTASPTVTVLGTNAANLPYIWMRVSTP